MKFGSHERPRPTYLGAKQGSCIEIIAQGQIIKGKYFEQTSTPPSSSRHFGAASRGDDQETGQVHRSIRTDSRVPWAAEKSGYGISAIRTGQEGSILTSLEAGLCRIWPVESLAPLVLEDDVPGLSDCQQGTRIKYSKGRISCDEEEV